MLKLTLLLFFDEVELADLDMEAVRDDRALLLLLVLPLLPVLVTPPEEVDDMDVVESLALVDWDKSSCTIFVANAWWYSSSMASGVPT